jgi:CheY-like chemotaxis protein
MPGENLTILLIDDDDDDYYILRTALEEIDKSITCIHLTYCEDAIEKLAAKNVNPGYIFLDLNMPRMGGRECLIQLKKLEHLNGTPIIIYTTSKRAHERKELLDIGADYYMHKTNTVNELIDELKIVIPN